MENFSEDNNLFFLLKKEHGKYINIFEGCTRKIALDNNKIYTEIEKWYRGDPDGIYVLDMENNKTYGPLDKIPEGIKLNDVEIFYENL